MGVEHDYNKFIGFSGLSYNIISHLINNDDTLWKMLKFPTSDALSKPNLTKSEKSALIYKGQEDSTPFRVFTSPFVDDAVEMRQAQIHIYTGRVNPENYVTSVVDFVCDILCHNKIAILSNAANRLDVMFEHVMNALNGRDIESLGRLYFNAARSRGNGSRFIKPNDYYIGYQIVMSANFAGVASG
jgi:hypothetical protein